MKIGLIAMSGIRACDDELLRLGLTLPGFVERSRTIASLPSLGLLTLAGMTPAEHEVAYIEVPDLAALDAPPDGFDLVAISSFSAQMAEAYDLAQRYRDEGVPVVMGGLHVTALPGEAADYCDAVVVGEGEPVWHDVLSDCANGRLCGIYDARTRDYDLADAPMPAFELLDISKYNRLTVQASRGCPHRCAFCASSVLLTDKYKQKPVAKVVAEIDRILELWDHPFLEFADDNACVDKAYWKELAGALKDRPIKWFAETDVSVSEDDDLLELLRRSGCAQLLIGFESPVETGLAGVEQRSDWKLKRFGDYAEAVRNVQSHGITVNGCFVIGLDGHTTEIFDQVFDFVKSAGLYEVQITVLTPFPGTPIYERLQQEDRLLDMDAWRRCTLFDVNYRPRDMSVEELSEGFKGLMVRLYSDEFTKWRRSHFKEILRKRVQSKGDAS